MELKATEHRALVDYIEISAELRRTAHRAQQHELVARLQKLAREHQHLVQERKQLAQLKAENDEALVLAETKVEKAGAGIQKSEERLHAGEGLTSKDLLALQAEIEQAKADLSELEDEQLAVLEKASQLIEKDQELAAKAAEIAGEGARLQQERKSAAQQLSAEISGLEQQGQKYLNELNPVLAQRLAKAQATGHIPAALLNGGACGACGTALSGVQRDTVNNADPHTVFECYECEALLVFPL